MRGPLKELRRWGEVGGGALIVGLLALSACSRRSTPGSVCVWVAAQVEPAFDPDGPPDALRWALERMLSRGLVEEDTSGAILPDAAREVEVSDDSLVYDFHLRRDLRFTDGTRCRAADFRDALRSGLNRTDHATRAWLLGAVRGVDRVRAGRPLPALGIEAPDDSTVVLRLARPDRSLLRKLALPGVGVPWRPSRDAGWKDARGLGPYRIVSAEGGRSLELARARPAAGSPAGGPDTVTVRFVPGAARARVLLRAGHGDFFWPLAPGLLDETLPAGYQAQSRAAVPPRRLLLVMRADLPPTSKLAARHVLGHGINRGELLRDLGARGRELGPWLEGADRFDFPTLDGEQVRQWLEAGKLGRSFHVVMAYDRDGPAAEVARGMQGAWARLSIYVELNPLGGRLYRHECLDGRSHLLLVPSQGLIDDPAADLAALVMPLRGPPVGGFRSGWRTREFDPWIAPRGAPPPLPVEAAQERLEQEMVALPLARLPWVWVERNGRRHARFHPHFGPECAAAGPSPAASDNR